MYQDKSLQSTLHDPLLIRYRSELKCKYPLNESASDFKTGSHEWQVAMSACLHTVPIWH